MKKIINGKMYNTKTAKCLAEWSNDLACNDFHFQYESLYQKTNGEYFLVVDGGPFSDYGVNTGNGTRGSDDIIRITESEAKAWVERRCNEEYEACFGPVEE